ncbi:MAG: hypothetical protein AAFX93_15805 [Verrucomicrobiota bacterium]
MAAEKCQMLTARDLGYVGDGNENPVEVIIDGFVGKGELRREDGTKTEGVSVRFKGAKRALELNKSNETLMRIACGVSINCDHSECIGKKVSLTVRWVDNRGDIVPAVRFVITDEQIALLPSQLRGRNLAQSIGKPIPWSRN